MSSENIDDKLIQDHEYDGIRELDNCLPPWWLTIFWGAIIYAAIYLTVVHVFGVGGSSKKQYDSEVARWSERSAQAMDAARRKAEAENALTAAETVAAVEPLTDSESLAKGKKLFAKNCVVCHGADGGGTVGPNLTDNTWIHGCEYPDIVNTISNGVPVKGMIAWQTVMADADIQRVASYVLTLSGTKPVKPKAAEGKACE